MSNVRTNKNPGIFAKNAQTSIPNPPVPGVPYRDSIEGTANIAEGWPYEQKVLSQEWNEILFRLTTLTDVLDKTGVLGWCNAINYDTSKAFVVGSDDRLYESLQSSGPDAGGAKDPVSEPTFWRDYLSAVNAAIALNSQAIADNASDISDNIDNIAINAQDIAGNSIAISLNTQAIADNASDISDNIDNIAINSQDLIDHKNANDAHPAIKLSASTANNDLSTNTVQGQLDELDSKIANSSGPVRNYTTLFNVPGGIDNGDITLSQSFRNFDEIEVVGGSNSGLAMSVRKFTPREYDLCIASSQNSTPQFMLFDGGGSNRWNGYFSNDVTFVQGQEDARIYQIIGVKLGS